MDPVTGNLTDPNVVTDYDSDELEFAENLANTGYENRDDSDDESHGSLLDPETGLVLSEDASLIEDTLVDDIPTVNLPICGVNNVPTLSPVNDCESVMNSPVDLRTPTTLDNAKMSRPQEKCQIKPATDLSPNEMVDNNKTDLPRSTGQENLNVSPPHTVLYSIYSQMQEMGFLQNVSFETFKRHMESLSDPRHSDLLTNSLDAQGLLDGTPNQNFLSNAVAALKLADHSTLMNNVSVQNFSHLVKYLSLDDKRGMRYSDNMNHFWTTHQILHKEKGKDFMSGNKKHLEQTNFLVPSGVKKKAQKMLKETGEEAGKAGFFKEVTAKWMKTQPSKEFFLLFDGKATKIVQGREDGDESYGDLIENPDFDINRLKRESLRNHEVLNKASDYSNLSKKQLEDLSEFTSEKLRLFRQDNLLWKKKIIFCEKKIQRDKCWKLKNFVRYAQNRVDETTRKIEDTCKAAHLVLHALACHNKTQEIFPQNADIDLNTQPNYYSIRAQGTLVNNNCH